MSNYTPEPYRAFYTDLPYGEGMSEGWTVDGPDGSICTLDCPLEDREAMAKRIAAMFRACAGIPTEALEGASVKALAFVVRSILHDLPSNKDWLDPHLEQQAHKLCNAFLKGDDNAR